MENKQQRMPIVGMRHQGPQAETIVRTLAMDEALTLEREPTNQYDANAVKVIARGEHVGYVPKHFATPLAAKMDAEGKTTIAAKYGVGSDKGPRAILTETTGDDHADS